MLLLANTFLLRSYWILISPLGLPRSQHQELSGRTFGDHRSSKLKIVAVRTCGTCIALQRDCGLIAVSAPSLRMKALMLPGSILETKSFQTVTQQAVLPRLIRNFFHTSCAFLVFFTNLAWQLLKEFECDFHLSSSPPPPAWGHSHNLCGVFHLNHPVGTKPLGSKLVPEP